ncbi:hypothetical protein COA01_15585 [Bacillus cereus]|uniref:hypothetical protein n=1 Tax=Bacillus cereus TaxID=1396 RepID=UPI000BFD84CA|nr:hypothetical protein [Bacillus cereus]PGP20960.1 hypothetical protein COA01_15585 [Bacillus cereus]
MDRFDELKVTHKQIQQIMMMKRSLKGITPSKKEVPFLLSAREALKKFVIENPNDALARRLLLQAEEFLSNYNEDAICQEKTLELSGDWEEINLSPEQLVTLELILGEMINSKRYEHSQKDTRSWLKNNVSKDKIPKVKTSKIIKEVQNQGGFCGCEVHINVLDKTTIISSTNGEG